MLLEGSCHCGAVRFTVESPHPYPFNVCYCSICRKTAGASGSAINLSARYDTLKVRGEKHIRSYRAEIADGKRRPSSKARPSGNSAEIAAARFGYGTRDGLNWCIRMLPSSIPACRSRPSGPI